MGSEGIDALASGEVLEALADDRFWIGGPAGEREETAVHVEGRAGARAAIGSGRIKNDFRVVQVERMSVEKLRDALRDELIAEPFGLAQAFPAIAPVGFEAVGVADALEARHVTEERGEPGDKSIDRPSPCWDLALFICVVGFRDTHGRHYTPAFTPADPVPLFPPNSRYGVAN